MPSNDIPGTSSNDATLTTPEEGLRRQGISYSPGMLPVRHTMRKGGAGHAITISMNKRCASWADTSSSSIRAEILCEDGRFFSGGRGCGAPDLRTGRLRGARYFYAVYTSYPSTLANFADLKPVEPRRDDPEGHIVSPCKSIGPNKMPGAEGPCIWPFYCKVEALWSLSNAPTRLIQRFLNLEKVTATLPHWPDVNGLHTGESSCFLQ